MKKAWLELCSMRYYFCTLVGLVLLMERPQLTHNVHGPHDAKFYAYLADLEQEYETLRRSGWDGEGFLSNGTRLGKGVSHDVPVHAARQKILDAIEKRKRAGGLSSGPQRLGGAQTGPRLTPRELAAEVWFMSMRQSQRTTLRFVVGCAETIVGRESVRTDDGRPRAGGGASR
jgi:hypothetical protein